MTLALAIEATDGVVVAADSRTAIEVKGRRVAMDSSIKLYRLSDHVAATESGAGDLARYLIEKLQPEVEGAGADGVRDVFELLRPHVIAEFDAAVSREQHESSVGLIFGGMDRDENGEYTIPRILSMYSQEGFKPLQATTGLDCTGSIWIAEYLFARFYNRDMDVTSAARLAALLISETATQDWVVGGPIQIAEITKSGFRPVDAPEVHIAMR